MANQITIQAALSCQGGALTLQGGGTVGPFNQASSAGKSLSVIRSPDASNAVVKSGELTTTSAYWVLVKNVDTGTNVLTLKVATSDTGTGATDFGTLKPGEFSLICVKGGNYVMVTGSGSNNVQVVAAEP